MPSGSVLKGYVMPIVTSVLCAAIIGVFVRGSSLVGQVAENNRGVQNLTAKVAAAETRISLEWEKLQQHLMDEAAADQQMVYVQQKIEANSKKLEDMNVKMTDMLLMQRDLLNEIKSNQRKNYPDNNR